jgi:hypothetical protein
MGATITDALTTAVSEWVTQVAAQLGGEKLQVVQACLVDEGADVRVVARLREPVAMMSEDGELLAFVRPSKSA